MALPRPSAAMFRLASTRPYLQLKIFAPLAPSSSHSLREFSTSRPLMKKAAFKGTKEWTSLIPPPPSFKEYLQQREAFEKSYEDEHGRAPNEKTCNAHFRKQGPQMIISKHGRGNGWSEAQTKGMIRIWNRYRLSILLALVAMDGVMAWGVWRLVKGIVETDRVVEAAREKQREKTLEEELKGVGR